MIKSIQINILVIGSGLAGVVAAISVADKGKQVTIITKTPDLKSGNTPCAQGGIVFQCKTDSLEKLKSDIISAGDNHSHNEAVKMLCTEGPGFVQNILIDRFKIEFNTDKTCTHADGL